MTNDGDYPRIRLMNTTYKIDKYGTVLYTVQDAGPRWTCQARRNDPGSDGTRTDHRDQVVAYTFHG